MYPFNSYNLPTNFDVDSLFNLLHQQQYYQHPPNSRPRVVKKLETEDEFQIQIYKPYGSFNDYEVLVIKSVPPIVKVIITSVQDRFRQEFQFNINYIDIENINWQWYKSRNILCLNIPKRIHYVHSNLEDILNCLIGNHHGHELEHGPEHEHEHHYMDEDSDFDEEDACPEKEVEATHKLLVNGFVEQRKAELARKAEEERRSEEAKRQETARQEAEQRAREAEEQARREAEQRAREAEEQARREAEEQARQEAKRKAELEYRKHVQQEANRKAAARKLQAEQAKAQQKQQPQQTDYDDFIKQQRDFLNQFFGFNLGVSPSPQPQYSKPAKPAKPSKPSKPKPEVAPKPENLRRQSIPVKIIDGSKVEQQKVSPPLEHLHKHPSLEEVEDEESIMFRKKFGH